MRIKGSAEGETNEGSLYRCERFSIIILCLPFIEFFSLECVEAVVAENVSFQGCIAFFDPSLLFRIT
jgi:hypothetical protein